VPAVAAAIRDATGLALTRVADPAGAHRARRAAVTPGVPEADLLVRDALLVATVDDGRRELPGGWVAVTDGLVSGVGGSGDPVPAAERVVDATGCLVTPGLVNTHHHLYQNLTRAFAPALRGDLFDWLVTLYPLWARLDEEAAYVSAYVGLTELALGGCTTTTDHLYVHPRGGGDLISAEIAAALELGVRFHPPAARCRCRRRTAGCRRTPWSRTTTRSWPTRSAWWTATTTRRTGAMVRLALAPVLAVLGVDRADAGDRRARRALDVRLHTHLAEDAGEDEFCLRMFGRRPVDYLDRPAGDVAHRGSRTSSQADAAEVRLLGERGVGRRALPEQQHDPRRRAGAGRELRAAGRRSGSGATGRRRRTPRRCGWRPGRRCCRASCAHGAGRDVGARRAGDRDPRRRRLPGPGRGDRRAVGGRGGDLVVWPSRRSRFAGRAERPGRGVAALRPVAARETVVAGGWWWPAAPRCTTTWTRSCGVTAG
jgi:hypothetical protein